MRERTIRHSHERTDDKAQAVLKKRIGHGRFRQKAQHRPNGPDYKVQAAEDLRIRRGPSKTKGVCVW